MEECSAHAPCIWRFLANIPACLTSQIHPSLFDPACGSGNFLTETYLCLRRLENEVIEHLIALEKGNVEGQIMMAGARHIEVMVSIEQFYGIEINDFAVSVAKTALWIAESQMLEETEKILKQPLEFLPLTTNAFIREGDALKLDWKSVVAPYKISYIMGNPPFVGASMMTKEQKAEAVAIFGKIKLANSIDYVGAWYHKAAAYINNTRIRVAFVSTNSITQGEQVAPLWEKLIDFYKIHIDFAFRTFKWDSEATEKAAVHCVIIGFSQYDSHKLRRLYLDESRVNLVENINPYLLAIPNILVSSRSSPICNVPKMLLGCT